MGSACKCSSQRRRHPMCLPGLCMQVLTTAPPPPHVPPRASRSGPMLGTWVGGAPNLGRDLVHACMRARASRCCGTRARARRAERPGRPDSLPRTFGFDRWSVCGRVHKAASILLIHSHLPDLHPLPSQGTLSSPPRFPFTPILHSSLPIHTYQGGASPPHCPFTPWGPNPPRPHSSPPPPHVPPQLPPPTPPPQNRPPSPPLLSLADPQAYRLRRRHVQLLP